MSSTDWRPCVLEIVGRQIVGGYRNLYLKSSIIVVHNPVWFFIAYGRGCAGSYHFDLRHRRGLLTAQRALLGQRSLAGV
jgi:hypothetical protein